MAVTCTGSPAPTPASGLTARQILEFYYPGTVLSTLDRAR